MHDLSSYLVVGLNSLERYFDPRLSEGIKPWRTIFNLGPLASKLLVKQPFGGLSGSVIITR